jgi:galactokinase
MENQAIIQEKLSGEFRKIPQGIPRLFRAPGRINLIGEHTDYNEGFVLPFAIDRQALVAGAARSDTLVNIHALDIKESATFDLQEPAVRKRGQWIDYIEGTIRCLQKRYSLTNGADLVFSSTVPIGAGLSSSAALEISTGLAILSLNKIEIDGKELAFAAREAEHEFVGVRTGIMDQFASMFGRKDHALLLDCRSLEITYIPLKTAGAAFVICDTKIKHQLASSEYNKRRAECEKSVGILREKLPGIESLREVTAEDLERFGHILPENLRRRCRHVINENSRTLAAADCLRNADLGRLGQLMFLSHDSLRYDYEVSCPELDALVETARRVKGVYGARMTGGGFGGCTINLVEETAVEEFRESVNRIYSEKFGFAPGIYTLEAGEGASEIT